MFYMKGRLLEQFGWVVLAILIFIGAFKFEGWVVYIFIVLSSLCLSRAFFIELENLDLKEVKQIAVTDGEEDKT